MNPVTRTRYALIMTFLSLSCVLCGHATAALVNFTWTPTAATPSLNGGAIVNANNYNAAEFASVTINTATGAFSEVGALNILNFLNGGSPVTSTGLDVSGGYSLYLVFSGTGTLAGIPSGVGTSTNGTLTSLEYDFIGSTNATPSFTVSNGLVSITDGGSQAFLGYGSLVPGTGSLSLVRTTAGYSPSENFDVTFNECTAAGQGGFCTTNESAFFTSPILPPLQILFATLSATDAVTTLTASGNTSFLNVNGGGGNLDFQPGRGNSVPEPSSLLLVALGIVALRKNASLTRVSRQRLTSARN